MNRLFKLLLLVSIIIIGCKTRDKEDLIVSQSINSLNMNIYSNQGEKLLIINSPYSNYDKDKNIFNLKETTIELFKDNESEYIIYSDNSKLSNNNKLIELNGNVLVKALIKKDDRLSSNNFTWNIDKSEFVLIGNVKFNNNSISLTSNKAILDKTNKIIKFFDPVEYKVNNNNNESKYEVYSKNAYYNIDNKSVRFGSNEERVRSKIYF